jgi:hypothetical protein
MQRISLGVLATLLLGASVAHTQPSPDRGGVRVAIAAGVASSRFSDFDPGVIGEDSPGSLSPSRRTGYQAGVQVTVPLNARIGLQPELHLVQKGASFGLDTGQGGGDFFGDVKLNIKLTYLEVPLLLRADLGREESAWRPFVVAGPSMAFRTGCTVGFSTTGFNADLGCDELGDEESGTTTPDPIETFDAGGLVGAGIATTIRGKPIALQLRYTRGLTTLTSASTPGVAPKNATIAVLVSLGLR